MAYKQAPRATANLVVIEAPGKLAALTAALRRGRLEDFHVLATRGHLFDMPDGFTPLGIDRRLTETARAPKNPDGINLIASWGLKSERLLIATDADQEGDVLAWDVAQILPDHPNVWRVRLRALDIDSVLQAFSNPEPVRLRDAWPGATRRLVDRLIGAAFTADGDHAGFAAGRVQSALLGATTSVRLPLGEATLVLPACDGKDPFVATVPVYPETRDRLAELVERSAAFVRAEGCVKLGKVEPAEDYVPWNYGEAVLSIAQATDRSLPEVADTLQRLYEGGRMSYPRSTAHALTGEGIARLQDIAHGHGVKIDADRLPAFSRRGRHTHESLRPLAGKVDVCAPLLLLSADDAALALITRHLIACAQPHATHRPDPATLPEWARDPKLDFSRRVCQWLRPWPRRPAAANLRVYPTSEVAMRTLLEHDLGRPSTQVRHATKFESRSLLTSAMEPSAKARLWLEQTPQTLLDPRTSAAIEAMIDDAADLGGDALAPAQLARGILERLGLWSQIEAILEAPAQPNVRSGLVERTESHTRARQAARAATPPPAPAGPA